LPELDWFARQGVSAYAGSSRNAVSRGKRFFGTIFAETATARRDHLRFDVGRLGGFGFEVHFGIFDLQFWQGVLTMLYRIQIGNGA